VERTERPNQTCRFCGATHTRSLGLCSVCALSVCEQCGHVQFGSGNAKAMHEDCLRKNEDHFTMIKFVR
jgi:hypothetical protein